MDPITVQTLNLGKHFGRKRVLDDVNLEHTHGVLGLAGPNGSGKSTLLQCLAGLIRPTSGQIKWYKKDQNIDIQKIKKQLGYAAPYINLYEELTCKENLLFLMQLRKKPDGYSRTAEVMERTEIASLADQPFGKLSTGQQQRLRLAAAIVHQPAVLFLDEPGSNLDENGRTFIASLVSEFKESGRPVILASNNPYELALCDVTFFVTNGQLKTA